MGLCLSCLSGSQSDEDDETTSLLRRSQQNQSPDYLQEEELMKQHKRQQELNHIVNDLSDKLIDVASFLSSKNHANNYNNGNTSSSTKPSLSTQLSTMGLNTQTSFGNLSLGDIRDEETSSASVSRQYPYIYNQSEKEKVLRKSKSLGDSVRQACQVTVSEPLYLKF
ncbi:hypothetical protein PVL30_001212 [Lodderomyces elongisporus]|uniref:uncharacterized protein n=1 Tax=Lodderomyces elongisporus TaxID=36914 RepID=UPI0029241D11|nr:uncharacterized protein PVL30_001212 [Lodderomyces elongisporus]WLF77494.1 hypothetical protein PVL30_001212 [Lodderomyces elongisporus]